MEFTPCDCTNTDAVSIKSDQLEEVTCKRNRQLIRLSSEELDVRLAICNNWFKVIKEDLEQVFIPISKEVATLLTDSDGVVIYVVASDLLRRKLEKYNIGVGTSFALNYAGINAISIAMQLKKIIVLNGNDLRNSSFLSNMSTVCAPFHTRNFLIGYIQIIANKNKDLNLITAFLSYFSNTISKKIGANEQIVELKKCLRDSFLTYKLFFLT